MTEFPNLYRRFLALVGQPRPLAEAALLEPAAYPLRSWIRATNEAEAVTRLGVYAHMYFARLRDSLREDYAGFARIVGDDAFERLAAAYLVAHPSDNPSLRYHGRWFASFVECELASGARDLGRPDLADLCRLEWARIETFDAPNARAPDRAALVRLLQAASEHTQLTLVPAHRLLDTQFEVTALFRALDRGAALPAPVRQRQQVLVWRRGFSVFHRPLDASEALALTALARGASLVELCGHLAGNEEPIAEAAARTLAYLRQWCADELVLLTPTTDTASRADSSPRPAAAP